MFRTLLILACCAVAVFGQQLPFTTTVTSPAAATAQFVVSVPSGNYIALGTQATGTTGAAIYPPWAVVCAPTVSTGCAGFSCTAVGTCAASATVPLTAQSTAGQLMTFTRPYATTIANDIALVAGANTLIGMTAAAASGFTPANTHVQNQMWIPGTITIPVFAGTIPTFGFSLAQPSATQVNLSFLTNAGKYAAAGFQTGSNAFPSFVAVCEPVTQTQCGVYDCAATATCVSSTTAVTQVVTAASRTAVVTRPLAGTSFTVNPAAQVPLLWFEQTVPTTLTIAPALVQSRTWASYLITVQPPVTAPTFPIVFTAPNATAIQVQMTPGSGMAGILGWRSATNLFPTAAVICASAITTCLDVTCTSASACTANSPSIISPNSVSSGVATYARLLAAPSFPIAANSTMLLTWALGAIPATTTTLAANMAQGVTWNYYTAPTPSSSVLTASPLYLLGLIAALILVA